MTLLRDVCYWIGVRLCYQRDRRTPRSSLWIRYIGFRLMAVGFPALRQHVRWVKRELSKQQRNPWFGW